MKDANEHGLNIVNDSATLLDKNFMQRSDAAKEVIAKKAGVLENWALLGFVGILIGAIIVCHFISYHEYIEAPVNVKSVHSSYTISKDSCLDIAANVQKKIMDGILLGSTVKVQVEGYPDNKTSTFIGNLIISSKVSPDSFLFVIRVTSGGFIKTKHSVSLREISQSYVTFIRETNLLTVLWNKVAVRRAF